MGISRFKIREDSADIIGKADFEAFYSGTLQQGDDNKIPIKSKSIDVHVNKLHVILQQAMVGVSVDFTCYQNGTPLGTVTLTTGVDEDDLVIGDTLITAGDRITWAISWTGTYTTLGITASMYLRVSA
jgi:hypothetical protein